MRSCHKVQTSPFSSLGSNDRGAESHSRRHVKEPYLSDGSALVSPNVVPWEKAGDTPKPGLPAWAARWLAEQWETVSRDWEPTGGAMYVRGHFGNGPAAAVREATQDQENILPLNSRGAEERTRPCRGTGNPAIEADFSTSE